jgi:hypothetical protein
VDSTKKKAVPSFSKDWTNAIRSLFTHKICKKKTPTLSGWRFQVTFADKKIFSLPPTLTSTLPPTLVLDEIYSRIHDCYCVEP